MREISLDDNMIDLPVFTVLNYGDTKCISGDAFIGYQVRKPTGELQNSKGGTLAHLYRRFNRLKTAGQGYHQRKQTMDSEFWCPSMTEDGRIFQNKILAVTDSGVRLCVRVRTSGGLELICTPDHPIANDSRFGFVQAGELSAGAKIFVHRHVPYTVEADEAPRVHRPELYVKHHPIAPTKIVSSESSRSGEYAYKRLRRSRAVYEAHMNGLTLDAYVMRLNDGRLDGLQFLGRDVDVHHKDEDKLNDVPSNLMTLTRSEHMRGHFVLPNGRPRIGSYMAVEDTVISVESAGEHQTYDIKMSGPSHNFVADGFVVHNSGKTTFSSTWPRPLILADAVERGYESVRSADRSTWFEPEFKPQIWALESLADLVQLAAPGGRIDQLIATGQCRTIVMDALSYFVELMLNAIITQQTKADNRAAYGDLGKQLRNVRNLIQSKPVSVLWNCITKHPSEDDNRGRPLIPGAQGEAWPGACDFVFRSKVVRDRVLVDYEEEGPDGKIKIVKRPEVFESFQINTRQNGVYIAGHRLGVKADQLPDPFVGSYSDLVTCLGYDVEVLRKSIKTPPKVRAAAAVASSATPAVPPVIVRRSVPPKVAAAPPQANNNKR